MGKSGSLTLRSVLGINTAETHLDVRVSSYLHEHTTTTRRCDSGHSMFGAGNCCKDTIVGRAEHTGTCSR